MFLPCNLNMSFNLPWITSNCVQIVQNSVEVKRITLKCKHEKKKKKKKLTRFKTLIAEQLLKRFKSTSINTKLKIKVHIDKQLLLVTKLEYKVVNVILQQLITCSNSPKENTRKRSKGCLKLTIKTLCDII